MDTTVWIDSWQQQCCGPEFAMGSFVRWPVSETADADGWAQHLLGPGQPDAVRFEEEHHGRDVDGVLTGVVTAIEVVTCQRVLGDAPRPGPGGKAYLPVPGSGRRRRVDVVDLWEPEPPADVHDWSFDGWIVTLRGAVYYAGVEDAVPSASTSLDWTDGEATDDFLAQMMHAIDEESPLCELPQQVTVHGSPATAVHGPWNPTDCSAVLLRWFDCGWIELYSPDVPASWDLTPAEWSVRLVRRNGFHYLEHDDAQQLLRDPARWAPGAADGYACVVRSDAGTAVELERWMRAGRT